MRVLTRLLMGANLLLFVAAIAAAQTGAAVTGVVAEMEAGTDQGLDWHTDVKKSTWRRLAIIVHLSDEPFDGGI